MQRGGMYIFFKIIVEKRKYITGENSVTVSFQLPYSYWCKFEKKKCWRKVQSILQEMEKTYVQNICR